MEDNNQNDFKGTKMNWNLKWHKLRMIYDVSMS